MSFHLPTLHWKPSPNFSHRSGAPLDLIILHDCEGGYGASINWFQLPHSRVSAHLVLREDGQEATQMVAFGQKAWHCMQFNSRSIGLEMAGFAKKGYGEAEWQAAANIIACLLHQHHIPCKWAKGGHGPGVCSHYHLGAAGGGHSDPTTDPHVWDAFMDRLHKTYAATYATGVFSATWGRS